MECYDWRYEMRYRKEEIEIDGKKRKLWEMANEGDETADDISTELYQIDYRKVFKIEKGEEKEMSRKVGLVYNEIKKRAGRSLELFMKEYEKSTRMKILGGEEWLMGMLTSVDYLDALHETIGRIMKSEEERDKRKEKGVKIMTVERDECEPLWERWRELRDAERKAEGESH